MPLKIFAALGVARYFGSADLWLQNRGSDEKQLAFTWTIDGGKRVDGPPFALKPLITVETDDYVALANEEIAIRSALGSDGVAHEPTGHVSRIWRRPVRRSPSFGRRSSSAIGRPAGARESRSAITCS